MRGNGLNQPNSFSLSVGGVDHQSIGPFFVALHGGGRGESLYPKPLDRTRRHAPYCVNQGPRVAVDLVVPSDRVLAPFALASGPIWNLQTSMWGFGLLCPRVHH